MNSSQNTSTSPPEPVTDAPPSSDAVQRIEYAVARPAKDGSVSFWRAFVWGFVPGAIILNAVDDLGHRYLNEYPKAGAILCLICPAIVVVLAGVVRQIWPRYRSAGFAVVFAVLGPLLLYLGWISLYILTRP